ncbi:MAG: HPr family phosphocarrier protein [Pseudobutyrivibrio ruminis]|nr:HPr family phosphocarrier protein [Pseudobutyrivibrio ruminis]
MKEFTYVVKDENGIHARPAGQLVKEAREYNSKIVMFAKDKEADLTKLIQVMALAVKQGDEIAITAEGEDEAAAIENIEAFVRENL